MCVHLTETASACQWFKTGTVKFTHISCLAALPLVKNLCNFYNHMWRHIHMTNMMTGHTSEEGNSYIMINCFLLQICQVTTYVFIATLLSLKGDKLPRNALKWRTWVLDGKYPCSMLIYWDKFVSWNHLDPAKRVFSYIVQHACTLGHEFRYTARKIWLNLFHWKWFL